MRRRHFLALFGSSVSIVAGCGRRGPDQNAGGSGPTLSESPTATSRGTSASTLAGGERNADPHEFVRIERVRNRSAVEAAPENETADFRDLSPQRRETFRKGLNRSRVAADGWDWYNESHPTYVRYNGTWYRVLIGVH